MVLQGCCSRPSTKAVFPVTEKGRRGGGRLPLPFYRILRLFSRNYSLSFPPAPLVVTFYSVCWFFFVSNIFVLKDLRAQSLVLYFLIFPLYLHFSFCGLMVLGTVFMPTTLKYISPTQNFLLNSRLLYQATSSTSPLGCLMDILYP